MNIVDEKWSWAFGEFALPVLEDTTDYGAIMLHLLSLHPSSCAFQRSDP